MKNDIADQPTYIIMAFDTKRHSWDYCGNSNNRVIAEERARSLAVGRIITFVQDGYVSSSIAHKTTGFIKL